MLRLEVATGTLTVILGEAHAEVGFLDLLHKHVFLVEEEHDGGGGEVAVVADAVEQVQTFVHPVLKKMDGWWRWWGGGKGEGFSCLNELDQKWRIVPGGCIGHSWFPTTSSSSTSTMS